MHKESLSLSLAMASLQKPMFTCFLLFAAVELALAEIHKVGDSEGWTVGNISYKSWAGKRNFHVGDIIIFEYNQQFHNVLQVSRANYRSCNGTAPIASFTTGNDSIPIKRKGHYLFICGFPGHCSIGQKVDIRVVDPNAAPASSPSFPPSSSLLPLSPSSSSSSTPASSPIAVKSNHAPISKGLCFLGLAIVSMSVFLFSEDMIA